MNFIHTFSDKNKSKKGSLYKKALPCVLGVILLAIAAILYVNASLSAVSTANPEEVVVDIPEGANSKKIANLLEENGLIRNKMAFIYYTRYTGLDAQLKPGVYQLNKSLSTPEIIDVLVMGTGDVNIFTVPEGYTISQIASLLESKGLVNQEQFYNLVSNGEFNFPYLDALPEGTNKLEGYLFPDTYHVGSNITGEQIISMMLNRFEQVMEDLDFIQIIEEKGISLHDAITIASMVEGEAKIDEERPLIAGVIFNRLRVGMPLQIDATVQYVLEGHRSVIYYKDLEVDSPYNTYRVNGLPPGPICSPGKMSLKAVLEPADTDYFYYVAKPDGTHAFARTLAEHNANSSKYQR